MPDRDVGVVMFADISGFTPLAAALVQELGPLRGAEELTRQLNLVYSSLIGQVHAYRGSVVGFSGDAITCWFHEEHELGPEHNAGRRAVMCAAAMQAAMQQFIQLPTPGGALVSLAVKVALVSGPVRRYVVGAAEHGLVDVVAGRTLDEVASAEHLARPGEIIIATGLADQLAQAITIGEWRVDAATNQRYAVVAEVRYTLPPAPWTPIAPGSLDEELVRPWLLPAVYARLRSGQGEFLAELRPAVALFMGFSGIDHDSDDAAGDKLDALIRWVQRIVDRYAGVLIQVTLGDKGSYLYAAFGAPQAHDDDPARAVGAALELIAAPQHMDFVRDVRIGVTVGRMRTGAYGSTARRTYGVLGSKTNLAARLMAAAQPGQILCDEDLGRSAGNRWQFESLPPLRVKGRAEPIPVCQPVGRIDSVTRRASAAAHAPLIGRQAELARVTPLLEAVKAGGQRVLLIEGEAGIGKSRLALELGLLSREQGLEMLLGAGQSIEQHTPYRAWRDVFHDFLHLDVADAPLEQLKQVRLLIAAWAPDLVEWLPLLDDVLGRGWADSEQTAALAPELRRQILFGLLSALLHARAAQQPLVVILEDAQWLDELSWALASALAGDARLAASALLLVLVTRPASASDSFGRALAALRSLPQTEAITLDTLTPDETVALAATRLGLPAAGLPGEAAQLVRSRAQGNPFFAEELIYTLRDHSLIRVEPDPDRAGDALPNRCEVTGDLSRFAETLPDTIQGLVLARVDRLTVERQLALKVAAVIGRTFAYAPLLHLMRSTSAQVASALREHLEALSQNDLTDVETPEPDLSYIFSHIITQEVAYQTLLFAQRQELHRRAAEWYEATFADGQPLSPHARLASFYPLLVYHYRQAEEPQREQRYARLAGEHAARQFANDESVMYLGRALALTPADALRERFELLLAREKVYDVQADRASQQADLAELEALAAQLGDAAAQAEVALRQARCFEYLGDFEQAFTAVDRGLQFAPVGALEAVALQIMAAGLHHRQGRHRDALEWCQKALETPGLPAAHRLRAHAESLKGVNYTYLGRPGEALAPLQLALAQYEQLEELPGQFDVASNLGLALFLRARAGDWKQAYGYLSRAQRLAERMGDAERKARISTNLGWLAYCLGDAARAIEHYSYSLQTWRTSGSRVMSAIVRTNLGAAELAIGDSQHALTLLQEAAAALEEAGARGQLAETRRYLAQAYLATGDLATAQAEAQLALALARAAEAPLDEAGARRVLGQIALAAGQATAAVTSLEASRALLVGQGNRYELAQTLTALAEALLVEGQTAAAQSLLTEAAAIFVELDASRDLGHAMRLLQG